MRTATTTTTATKSGKTISRTKRVNVYLVFDGRNEWAKCFMEVGDIGEPGMCPCDFISLSGFPLLRWVV